MQLEQILRLSPVIPVITIEKMADAVPLARALVNGGLRVLEITLRTSIAPDALRAMRESVPNAVVGAGTLVKEDDFVAAEAAGAQFGVSPGLTPNVIELAKRAKFPMLPGVATASELMMAREAGFELLKFFPAEAAGGLAMLKSFAGPFAATRFCPTGGITLQSAPSYLALKNVMCVGGSWMVPNEAIQRGEWQKIEALAHEASQLARK